ncbi:MAG: hypothetical protein NTV51_00730 [Verrucomicrobia bacterium]|nr:hypothetical protein [Verrucomicrobiota bacterium]
MFAKVLAGSVKASLHRSHRRIEGFGDFRMAATFLHKGEESAVLRAELGERVAEGVKLLRIDRAGRLGNVFVFFAKRQEDPPQFLATELVDARVAREAKKPRFKLGRRLQTIDRPDHLDKDLLGKVFNVIAPIGHGVDKSRNPVLVSDNELPLGVFVALLSPADKVGQRGR